MKNFFMGLILAVTASLSFSQTSTGYSTAQHQQSVVQATVVGVRDVTFAEKQSSFNAGSAIGGLIGTLVGGEVARRNNGGGWSGSFATTAIGTAIGAKVGDAVANRAEAAQEVILKFEDGKMTAITQSVKDGVLFQVGQKVIIIGGGRIAPSPI